MTCLLRTTTSETLAQSIIDAQENEIADTLAWLAKQPRQ